MKLPASSSIIGGYRMEQASGALHGCLNLLHLPVYEQMRSVNRHPLHPRDLRQNRYACTWYFKCESSCIVNPSDQLCHECRRLLLLLLLLLTVAPIRV